MDEMNTTEEENAMNTYPLIQVDENDDYCDAPKESQRDISDLN
ncbi:hypothetical protein MKW94_005806, partial [Papaver nudicaule]|nr:hypothetical protein [Papaver nudicaule]